MRVFRIAAGWLFAVILIIWRVSCRYRVIDDPRPALRRAGKPYTYAILHAHQVAAVFVNDEPTLCAMVSRSADGDLLVPSLRLRRVATVRGSTRRAGKDKGGRQALAALGRIVQQGTPGLIAVDGPRGPRNRVHRGIADLAHQSGCTVLPTVIVSSRHWVLPKSWDRFQIPKPFAKISLAFSEPIEADGHTQQSLQTAVGTALMELETRFDPAEAATAQPKQEVTTYI